MIRFSHIPCIAVLLSFLVSSSISVQFNGTTAADHLELQDDVRHLNSINSNKYVVKTCLADGIGKPCTGNTSLKVVSDLRLTQQEADNCEGTEGQKGSVTYTDLILPTVSNPNQVLFVEVTTKVPEQNSLEGFFVRPTRLTRYWGKATISEKKASFYLADTGQFSVEFASDAIWRNKKKSMNFDALMLFVNPEITIPTENVITVRTNSNQVAEDLGPNKNYVFKANINYDWGADHVFKVHDNTNVYFETGAHVRARIVQTEKKVKNVLLKGYGTLDVHYDLDDDDIGINDDATRQNIGIYGKNIRVMGLTLLNTNPTCDMFGYCLNINANWSPLTNSKKAFDVYELQVGDPPYTFYQAHCQENNMDDSPNTDFTNCPTSHENGQHISYVKCMTWQMGHDGMNAGKWGTIEKSFVRTIDDAIKPWDSHGIYKDITIWQLALGWPINFGWWNWNQPDVGTTVDSIYVVHNHNWVTSPQWPATKSGQCTVGGIYGSGAHKSGYRLSNIFVETAASCAVGLEISKNAYSKHLTLDGCVANIADTRIEGMYFDEDFFQTGGYTNYLSGEANPPRKCTGDLAGKIEDMVISGSVAGKPLTRNDFVVEGASTVTGLRFEDPPPDPHPSAPHYTEYKNSNAYKGVGAGAEIDDGVEVFSATQCLDRCQADWSCDCVTYDSADSVCYKLKDCRPSEFDSDPNYDVYVRKWEIQTPTPTPAPTLPPVQCSDVSNLAYRNKPQKNCAWVGRKNTTKRCDFPWKGKSLKDYCPETCNNCGCQDKDDLQYRNNARWNCQWVGKKLQRCDRKWKQQRLSDFCPKTCDNCSSKEFTSRIDSE